MRKRQWIFVSVIALLVAAVLFAMLIAAISPTGSNRTALSGHSGPMRAAGPPASRQVYSPTISNDPYVIDQWEKSVLALEKACRDSGEYCEHARKARRSLGR